MKRQTGKSFTPVCGAPEHEPKLQNNQHLISHHHLKHHGSNQLQDQGSCGCYSDDYERHGNDHQDHAFQNQTDSNQSFGGTEPCKEKQNTLSKAMTSSRSSSSSASSWISEPSLDNERYVLLNKPQHSVSCSNLPEAGNKFQDEELSFDPSDSAFTLLHHKQVKQHFGRSRQPEIGLERSQLHRCQSRSTEGLLQSMSRVSNARKNGRAYPIEFQQLYKTTSLGQSLTFNDNGAAAGVIKRAVSSIQLPSKSILKNKDKAQKKGNFHKANSMEALSTRNMGTGTQKQRSVETLKEKLVKEKVQFSAFLDEITSQIISPSRLSSLRINTSTTPKCLKSPQVMHKKLPKPVKQGPKYGRRSSKQLVELDNMKEAADLSKHHHNRKTVSDLGVPQNYQRQHISEKRPCIPESYGIASDKQNQGKYSRLLSEGSITSHNLPPQEKNHHARRKGDYGSVHGLSMEHNIEHEHKGLSASARRPLNTEFVSDLNKTSTGSNKENITRKKHDGHKRCSQNPHRDSSVISMDRAEFLEHYNKELHENLLQTVACIDNMETEVQCTKTELNSTKEKYIRLQESYSNLQQTNNALEEKIQSVVDSMNLERKYQLKKISELTKQLDAAKSTIISLENINVPSLIKNLLDKHFHSQDTLKNLYSSLPDQSDPEHLDSKNSCSPVDQKDAKLLNWLQPVQKGSADKQEHVTEFLPWTECQNLLVGSQQSVGTVRHKGEESTRLFPNTKHSPSHFTEMDLSSALCRQTSDSGAKGHDSMVTMPNLSFETENHSRSTLSHMPE